MSTGRDYEMFVQRLQQALLDSEEYMLQKNIKVERNKKITDRCGIDREFDLYWEYELAGITYKTIIECKDYASNVSVEKIDALIGKIHDIPDLKPVFATKTGYQSGAEKKAKDNRVDLLIVREQRDEDWLDKDGNPLIRTVVINLHISSPASITATRPYLDQEWLKENTQFGPDNLPSVGGLNTEIFIDDIDRDEKYSLWDMGNKLTCDEKDIGSNLTHAVDFANAYLTVKGKDTKLKVRRLELDYVIGPSTTEEIRVDYAKELIGVVEYLDKKSTVGIFKNGHIRQLN